MLPVSGQASSSQSVWQGWGFCAQASFVNIYKHGSAHVMHLLRSDQVGFGCLRLICKFALWSGWVDGGRSGRAHNRKRNNYASSSIHLFLFTQTVRFTQVTMTYWYSCYYE